MKVYRHIEEFTPLSFGVATTGTFDGVHQGHRFILDRLARIRDEHKEAESVLLTFDPHPREVLQPGTHLKLLNSMDEKIQRLEAAGLDHLVIHPFDRSFSRTSSLEFVRNILVQKLGVRKLVIGYDHHFGRNREDPLPISKNTDRFTVSMWRRYRPRTSIRWRSAVRRSEVP